MAEQVIGYIGLGANLGNPAQAIWSALDLLSQAGIDILAVSSFYRTPPWGNPDQPHFVNAVAKVGYGGDPNSALAILLEVERKLGRVRVEKWGPRAIDLDLLLLGDWKIAEEGLTLPHPFLEDRLFVLLPLADLEPDMLLPLSGTPIQAKIAQFPAEELSSIKLLS